MAQKLPIHGGPTPRLIEAFRGGDKDAYAVLWERYRIQLERFIRSHMDSELERHVGREDLFQETHFEALKSMSRFHYLGERSFFFWLCGIARNRIHHHCRVLKRRPPPLSIQASRLRQSPSADDLLGALHSPDTGPFDRVLLDEYLDVVAAALHSLPKGMREAVMLRVDGHDNRNAAHIAGVQPGAFRTRYSRGLAKLYMSIDELLPSPQAIGEG